MMEAEHRNRAVLAILVLLGASLLGTTIGRDSNPSQAIDGGGVATPLADLPGWFTENQGQIADSSVRFTYSQSGIVFLDSAVILQVGGATEITKVKLTFPGANVVTPLGEDESAHNTNYLLGANPDGWISSVRNYNRVIYPNLYENIDLVYYFTAEGLKSDWIVKPGGDPRKIQERYENSEGIYIDEVGGLVISTPTGNLDISKPKSFQGTQKVNSHYQILNENTIGYDIGDFDRQKTLVIDPLIYSTLLGGYLTEEGHEIAVDGEGCVYVTGYTDSVGLSTSQAFQTRYKVGRDAYVAKFCPHENSLVYFTYLGGSDTDKGNGIAVDISGNVYVTGSTKSTDFPVTPDAYDGEFNGKYNGNRDLFITKLSDDGSELLYSTFIGGEGNDGGSAIVVDNEANVYVSGSANGYLNDNATEFPTTFNVLNQSKTPSGTVDDRDAFVLKLSADGQMLHYSVVINANTIDGVSGIAIDKEGNLYATGNTDSTDFPVTVGAFDSDYNSEPYYWLKNSTDGPSDVFVFKLNSNGTSLLYSTYLGGAESDGGGAIAVDGDGYAYISGGTSSSNFPTTRGALDETYNGADGFITKLSPDGSHLIYSTFIGGPGLEGLAGLAIDADGRAYLTGNADPGFPITKGAIDDTPNGWGDVFVAVLSPDGTELEYSTYLGGDNLDSANDIALDQEGFVYITGWTSWRSDYGRKAFPTTSGAYDRTPNGNQDIFVVKLDPTPGGRLVEDEGSIPAPGLLSVLTVLMVVVIIGRRISPALQNPPRREGR